MKPSSLYVHIPFCSSICAYCDFCKLLYRKEFAFPYVEELFKEVEGKAKGLSFHTIYVGGGTPTCLEDSLFEKVLAFLSPYLERNGEFTIEANPESLSKEKLLIAKRFGVNRISMGLESSSKKRLKEMGRGHTYEEAKKAFALAKEMGFSNLNADLIYGLPDETLEELDKDIDALLALDVPHLSTYSLTINEGTLFYNKKIQEADDNDAADQYELILKRFREAGYSRYEVSNFARPGFESQHNLSYWRDQEYVGCGLGASGYQDGVHYTNTRNLTKYLKGEYLDSQEEEGEQDRLEYYFLTNLRLAEGFALEEFEKRFGFSFLSKYQKEVDSLIKDGLLYLEQKRVKPTDKGILLLDRILLALFK